MNDFLLQKIKNLKKIEPDSSWLSSQRSFLLSEISRTNNQEKRPSFLTLPFLSFSKIFKPAFIMGLFILILFSSLGTIGVISAAQNSLPGDFIYPVKTVFENAQMKITSGEENKTKLSMKFASQRIDEFNQLIVGPENKNEIEKTVDNLTAQLILAKENINKLKEKNTEKATEIAKLVKAQTDNYGETLLKGTDQLAYIIPEDKEELRENINQAVEANKVLKQTTEELISESIEKLEQKPTETGEIIIPAENIEGDIESGSFDDFQPEDNYPEGEVEGLNN